MLTLGRAFGRALGREEVAYRSPDVVEVVQGEAAGRATGRGELGEHPAGLGRKLPRQARGHLDVAGVAGIGGDGREGLPGIGRIAHRVVTVRGIEEIDVAPTRVVAGVDDLAHL